LLHSPITVGLARAGTPAGRCGAWVARCEAPSSRAVVERECLGKPRCVVSATNAVFGSKDPCEGQEKTLAVDATCGS
jgi:hypothetical protein